MISSLRKNNSTHITQLSMASKSSLMPSLILNCNRAAWSGTRIILQQVSPESQAIFDYVLELYRVCVTNCTGDWTKMASRYNVAMADMESFLNYAAMFLCNIGNYFVIIFLFADGELANSYYTRREKEIRSLSPPSRLTSSARLPCARRLRLNFLMNLKTLYWQSSLAALVRQARLHKVLTIQVAPKYLNRRSMRFLPSCTHIRSVQRIPAFKRPQREAT